MKIYFLGDARKEFLDAISYYKRHQPELANRFKAEVEQSITWLAEHVEAFELRAGGYRRLNLRVFPYYIPYIVRGSTLWILALAHVRRKPEYWIEREKPATRPISKD